MLEADASAVEICPAARGEVVESDDVVDAGIDERAAQVGADEPGAAGDDELHVDANPARSIPRSTGATLDVPLTDVGDAVGVHQREDLRM